MRSTTRPRPTCLLGSLLGLLVASASGSALATERITEPAPGTPDRVIMQVVTLAQDADEAKAFETYLSLIHPEEKETDRAVQSLRRYSWARFRRHVKDYVLPNTSSGFEVIRRDPPQLKESDSEVRIFLMPLNDKKRELPTPIRLKKHEGKWLVTLNSL
jgi:hypothetical protein